MRWLGFVLGHVDPRRRPRHAGRPGQQRLRQRRPRRGYVQQDLVRQQILTLVSAAAAGLAGVVILTGCALAESLAGVRAILDEQRLRDAAARAAGRRTRQAPRHVFMAAPAPQPPPAAPPKAAPVRSRPALATWGPAAPKPAADFEAAVAAEVPAVKNAASGEGRESRP